MKLKIKYVPNSSLNSVSPTTIQVYIEDQLFDTLTCDLDELAIGSKFNVPLVPWEYKKIYPVLAERDGYLAITYKPRTINQCPSPTVVHDVIWNGIVIDTVDKDDHNKEYSGRFPAYADEKLSEYRKNSYWAYVSLINKEYRGATNESIQAKKSLEPTATEVKQEAEAMSDGPVSVHSTKPSVDFKDYHIMAFIKKGSITIHFDKESGDHTYRIEVVIKDSDIRYGNENNGVDFWHSFTLAGQLYDINYDVDNSVEGEIYRSLAIYQIDTLANGDYQRGDDFVVANNIVKGKSK